VIISFIISGLEQFMLSLFGGNNSFQALEQDYLLLCYMVVYLSVNSAAYWIAGFGLQLD
jgi:hypothetical protein